MSDSDYDDVPLVGYYYYIIGIIVSKVRTKGKFCYLSFPRFLDKGQVTELYNMIVISKKSLSGERENL